MPYTKFILSLGIFLTACNATPPIAPPTATPTNQDQAAPSTAEQEITQYTTALHLLNINQLDQAETEFNELTAKHPDLAGPWANLGLIYIKKNQLDKARTYLDKSLAKNPRLAQAYNLLGYIEYSQGNVLKAKQLYDKALDYKEDYALAHYNLALLYDVYLHDIPKAVEQYQRYLELIKTEDKATRDWLNELRNTQKKGQS